MFTGLRSIIYPSENLDADKKFWTDITGVEPYYENPYYVGFDIAGNELGLDPNAAKEGVTYPVTYWKVADIESASEKVVDGGAKVQSEAKDVGKGIMMARFTDPSGNVFGLIENPEQK